MERDRTNGRRRGLVRGRPATLAAAGVDGVGVLRRRGAGLVPQLATDRWAQAAIATVDAASEAIAYDRCYEGAILEPADVPAAVRGITGTIRRDPATALAIASRGLTPASSLLRETDYVGPLQTAVGAGTRVAARPKVDAAGAAQPVVFYDL